MITMHTVIASEETSISTFQMRFEGMDIIIFPGEYIQQNQTLFKKDTETRITIPGAGDFQVWIYPDDIKLEKDNHTEPNFIDLLVWLTVPEGATSLEQAEIDFKKFVEVE